ncbi:MAG: helix-turn-helix domain-containing protein [Calothrix sp. MO_167.B12]|nr:helix-turn-helix domain-containing protein [Calothrix sp. MO_167.B12]
MNICSFPQNLRNIRQQKSYSQEQLAYESELATRTIQLYEKGDRIPTIPNLIKLSQALDTKTDELYPELKNINFIQIIRERNEREVKATIIFLEKSNAKDMEEIDKMLSNFKKLSTMSDHVDYACNIHRYLLRYVPQEYQIASKKVISEIYQQLFLNVILDDCITKKIEHTYFDVHCKLFQAVLDKKNSVIVSEYQNHAENEEKTFREYISSQFAE